MNNMAKIQAHVEYFKNDAKKLSVQAACNEASIALIQLARSLGAISSKEASILFESNNLL